MLLAGVNNTGIHSPETVAKGIAQIVQELHSQRPNAHILVSGIMPAFSKNSRTRRKIHKINKHIANLDSLEYVTYHDSYQAFVTKSGSIPKKVMSDGLHPTHHGYRLWAQDLGPQINHILAKPSQLE